jgi:Protein of unknown function (DUF1461)
MKYFYKLIFWPIFFICQLIALALISWHLAAQIHFAYPLGYKLLNLDEHIAEYAPLNRHKDDFELTDNKEHWRLFGEICESIQNHGKGLADIQYPLSNGNLTSLMHQNEIIHLQDVANLIDKFYFIGVISFIIWLAGLLFIYFRKPKIPSMKKVIIGFVSFIGITALIVLSIGSKDVFYWLHVKIFPEGHQWFFYYQDSLMTTLMKAPDIFAFIAVFLVGELILFWCACVYVMNRWLTKGIKNYKTT